MASQSDKTKKANQQLILVVVLAGSLIQPCLCFSPGCLMIVTVGGSHDVCTRTHQSGSTTHWQCADLQSALMMVVELNVEEQNVSNCVSIAVPPGDHLVTGPVHFGAASVYMFGSGASERSEDISISCNYTVDVDESRIFELDYNYTDYTFYFNRSDVVSFEMVQFIGCPYPLRLDTVAAVTVSNSTFRNFSEAVFDIFNCADVTIIESAFIDNSGTGISRHSFRANTGAVSIGYNNAPVYFPQIVARVVQCAFINNRATATKLVRVTSNVFSTQIFSGRGGGLGIFCNESYHNISLIISDTWFENNYARSFGGAVYLVKFGEQTQNMYMFRRNNFTNNVAPLGGGAVDNTFFSSGIPDSPNTILMSDCTFVGNVGQTGGALSSYLPYAAGGVSFIQCEHCYFANNHGNNTMDEYGAAVAIYRVNQFENRDTVPRYRFIDCTFQNNSGKNGVFTATHFPVTFNGTTKFISNTGTDLKIIGSLVNFDGNMRFMNHSGSQASTVALHLLSFGQIRFFQGLQLTFTQNDGVYGASILVDTPTPSTIFDRLAYNPQCFALYEDLSQPPKQWNNVSVTFQRNKAVVGSSISIVRLGTCSWVSVDDNPSFNGTFIYNWPIWDHGNDSINTAYVNSNAPEHSFVTTVESIITYNESVTAWPGKQFIIQLTGLDQFGHKTTVAARFMLTNHSLVPGNVMVNINPSLVVNYATETVSLVRNVDLTYSISSGEALNIDGPLGVVTIQDSIEIVEVNPAAFLLYPDLCPAGYILVTLTSQMNVSEMECQCDQNNTFVIHCENDQNEVIIREGYWGAAVLDRPNYHYDLFLYPCPPGYCKCSQNTSLGPSSCAFTYINSSPDAQCVCDRQGILCGECRGGKGVSVLLNNCVSCYNAQGLLILGLIIADAIAFIAIVVSDVPFPEWIYPFIFYIQIVPAIGIFFPESFLIGGKFLYFISSALSFYFVYDFCLYESLSPLVSYFLRFLPFLEALLLLPPIAIFREKKMMMLKHHGIWWIILLLYAHLIHTSMSILNCPFLITTNSSKPRWFINGNIGCFTGWHIPLALLAIIVLIVTILLIPLACLISLKQHITRRVYWLKYFEHPLTIAYKEKWRWWSAVELARRFIIILSLVPFPRNSMVPLFIMCIMLVIYGLILPYKSKLTNTLELGVQINFIILLALESTSFLKDTYNTFPTLPQMQPSVQLNTTAVDSNCKDTFNGISDISKILLPFYYLPLLLIVIIAIGKIIQYSRKSRSVRKEYLLTSTHEEVMHKVTMTELKIDSGGDYTLVTDDT